MTLVSRSRGTRSHHRSAHPRVESLEGRVLLSAGDLDTTFGGTGYVTTNLRVSIAAARSVVVQSDNKIVVACSNYQLDKGNGNFNLVRYNPDGLLDTTFGGTGIVSTDFAGALDRVSQIILESTSGGTKVLAVGYATKRSGKGIALARYNMNGSLDTTFGSGGMVFTQVSGKSNDSGNSVILDPAGRIVVGGSSSQGKSGSYTYANVLLRYNANGSLDTTFGSKGKVVGAYGSYTYDGWGTLEILGSGSNYKIGVLGTDQGGSVVAHFNTNGSRDTTFGSNGEVVLTNGGGSTFQPDGKIVGAYENTINGNDAVVAVRYNADGTPDSTFGTAGQVVTYTSSLFGGGQTITRVDAVGIDSTGRIVVTGGAIAIGASPWYSLLLRYSATGALDTSFGNNGAVLTLVNGSVGGNGQEYTALAFQPDGKIFVGGYVTVYEDPNTGSGTLNLDAARYFSDSAAPAIAVPSSRLAPVTSSPTPEPLIAPLAWETPGFLDTLPTRRPRRSVLFGG